jgi:hypothetical protein
MRNMADRSTHQTDLKRLSLQETNQIRLAQQTKNGTNGREYQKRIPARDQVASDLMIRRIIAELMTVE